MQTEHTNSMLDLLVTMPTLNSYSQNISILSQTYYDAYLVTLLTPYCYCTLTGIDGRLDQGGRQ